MDEDEEGDDEDEDEESPKPGGPEDTVLSKLLVN